MNMANALVLSGTPKLPAGAVALTYDDGPGPRTVELAELLCEQAVPATFFLLGESLERYGHLLDTYSANGHAIGLHGQQHRPFSSLSRALDQLSRCREQVADHLGETVWFRPPYGIADIPVPGYAGPVGWHAHGSDWDISYRRGQTVTGCVNAIVDTMVASDGGVVLLHDFAPYSEFTGGGLTEAQLDLRVVEITALLIERLRDRGFRLVGLPDPLANPVLTDVDGTNGYG
jgi:peptidoglycan/xylan/chitin deacetylase (PgdA/CDA1 family)